MPSIETLPFFVARVEFAGPNGFQINRGRADDRTTQVIKKWMAESAALKTARFETVQTLEAVPGKGNAVSLVVMDRPKFDSLQEAIKAHTEHISGLEEAIRALDEMGSPWFSDLADKVGFLGRSEKQENAQIANMTAGYLQRKANSGKTPEEILGADPEFQRLKNLCESRIKDANEKLAELRPKLEAMKTILESVGC